MFITENNVGLVSMKIDSELQLETSEHMDIIESLPGKKESAHSTIDH